MKKLLFILLLFTSFVNAQIVNIPDANFKNKLLSVGGMFPVALNALGQIISIDANSDGEIQQAEALNVYSLFLQGGSISSLQGIEYFTNLTYLDCVDNLLMTIDVSNLVNLESLYCDFNNLNNIVVNNCINLKYINISSNSFSSLNISNLPSLETLNCDNNQLTSLDVTVFPNLTHLNCALNQLTELNLTGLNLNYLGCGVNPIVALNLAESIDLTYLHCRASLLTSLDLTNNPNITVLQVDSTPIVSLDISSLSNLDFLDCGSNELTSIYMKNGSNEQLNLITSPNLSFICADESQLANIQAIVLPTTVVNSYCSFTPGGNYNTITGSMLFDADNNGCDINDTLQPNIKIDINDGTNQGATFTNNSGNYTFYTQSGSFDLTPNVENPTFFNFSPPTATISFANNNNNITTQNFCIAANGIHPDIEIVIAPITPARPGFDAVYEIVYKNKGNQMLSGNITFTYNDTVLDFVSATQLPDTQSTGLLNWNYTNLLPFENRSFYVTLNVNSPTETPTVNIGDILNFQATITPVIGDENAVDNLFTYNQTVVGSYDPNNIECIEGNVVPPSEIGNYLHYIINFENTGTFLAENIVVKTTIDATKFDVNSLQMLNTSHNAYIKQTGNVVEFIFENVALDSGGHGNVLLKIRSKNDLVSGDAVSKRADIFFDYNAPIDTGMANTTFQLLSNPGFELDNSISIYPNPANEFVNITSNNTIKSVQLYDVQGRLLQTQIIDEVQTAINISEKSNGIYFLKITSEKGIKVEKLIKE